MQKQTFFILAVIIIIAGVGYMVTRPSELPQSASTYSDADVSVDTISDNITQPDTQPMPSETPEAPTTSGLYATYTPEAVAASTADNIILFFKASWCPSCLTLDADITANTANIPAGTEIYTVDYDTALELRQKYGVTMQHTMVSIDSTGAMLNKWSGGNTLAGILAAL